MVEKRTFVCLALLGLIIALLIPFAAAADGCPPDNPNCNIEPPQSIEVNTDPLHADGSPVELAEPGALSPQLIPMPLPRNVDPLPLPSQETAEILPIPMRYQDPDDTTCGVHALGMALSGLGGDAPSSAAIQGFLEDNGMMYDFGTGVEELAYAAQSLGYKGSFPFHDWSLEDLQAELSAGRPVVVSLGANPGQNTGTSGEGNAGHFVTVTGISNGQVAFNDPTLGKQVISTEEFLRLWSLQGNSGVAVRREAPAGDSAGLAAWVAASAAAMALISQTPNALRRKGIGGRLDVGGAAARRSPAPSGYRWVQRQTPKYEWREVQEGWQTVPKTVPKMVRKYKPVGWTTMTERIPRYETVRVQDGWTYTYERVPTYRTERYIRSWRTEYTRQATFRYVGGRRIFAGYRSVARRVPVYGTRQVFAGYRTERKRVPRMVERRVLAGWDFVEKRVPKYGWVEEQDGWTVTTQRIPRMVRKQVQVGTETRWVLERVPQRPHLEFNLQGSNPAVRSQSDPAPPQSEPELVPVPSLWSDPIGWFQASAINLGRSNETAREVMTATLAPAADSLRSIADPERNPRTAAFHSAFYNGLDAWQGVADMAHTTVDYTVDAVRDGRWEDAQRGFEALADEGLTLAEFGGKAVVQAAWGIVTTPVRIFTTDIPEFSDAISERFDGQDRAWDVIFTAAMLEADIAGTYALAKPTGLIDRLNGAIEQRLFGSLDVGVPPEFLPPSATGQWRNWDLPPGIDTFDDAMSWGSLTRYRSWGPNRPLDNPAGSMLPRGDSAMVFNQNAFNELPLGRPSNPAAGVRGDPNTVLLWTIDDQGVHFALEQTPWNSERGIISHTNISENAYIGGEAWRTGPNQVTISSASGAFGFNPRTLSAAEITEAAARYEAAIRLLRDLGLEVNALPFGAR